MRVLYVLAAPTGTAEGRVAGELSLAHARGEFEAQLTSTHYDLVAALLTIAADRTAHAGAGDLAAAGGAGWATATMAADATSALVVRGALDAVVRDRDVVAAVRFGTANLDGAAVVILTIAISSTATSAIAQAEAGATVLVLFAFFAAARARGRVSTCQAKPKRHASDDAAGDAPK
ncbi:MAG: hypothetical protein ACJ789_19380 [Thermomicrobiales bacterium]